MSNVTAIAVQQDAPRRANVGALLADRDYIAKVNSGEFELRRYEKALSDQIKHPLFGEQP